MAVASLEVSPTDFAGMVDTVYSQVRGISRSDAEEAVSEAWLILERKRDQLDDGPINGWLVRTARFQAMKIRDKAKRVTSLDELEESDVDEGPRYQASSGEDVEALVGDRARLDTLDDDPVTRQIREAAEQGAPAKIEARGAASRLSRYSDEQVELVRSLRKEGLTYPQIEELTGVPASYAPTLCQRQVRATPTMDGWTPERIIVTLQGYAERNGRAPSWRDCESDLSLPSPNTLVRHLGGHREALRAAGLTPARDGQRLHRYSEIELAEILNDFHEREGRWPTTKDLREDPTLPAECTVKRRFGTVAQAKIAEHVRRRLRNQPPDPTAEQMAIVILAFRDSHGRWPTAIDFENHREQLPYRRPLLRRRFNVVGGAELGRAAERVLGFEAPDPDIAIRSAGEPPPPLTFASGRVDSAPATLYAVN